MKKKMTKKEIADRQKEAKSRDNRRLSDGEFDRVMAIMNKEGDEIIGDPIIDILTNENLPRIKWKHPDKKYSMPKEITPLQRRLSEILKDPNGANKRRVKRENRRLTDEQFQSLMKIVSEELGINDDKGLEILDLHKQEEMTPKQHIESLLMNMEMRAPREYQQYKDMTKGKKLIYSDKLWLISWLLGVSKSKPMRFIPKKDRVNKVRNKEIGLKKIGDIKIRPIRVLPDEEYIREVTGKERTTFDAFDKMDNDKKIIWARYAKSILGNTIGVRKVAVLFSNEETDIMQVAMKYACKMTGISCFQGRYKEPFWIVHRANKYCDDLTNVEYETFLSLAQKHIESRCKKTSKILSDSEFLEKLNSTLSNIGLSELSDKYKEWHNKRNKGADSVRSETVKSIMQFIEKNTITQIFEILYTIDRTGGSIGKTKGV